MLPVNQISNISPKTIVIVDDSLELTRVYQQVLELEGYRVFLAGSGPDALELLTGIPPPDLLLVDYAMPGMNGAEFLKELETRNPSIFKITPIVGLSGLYRESPMLKEMRSMVCRLVEKPDGITRLDSRGVLQAPDLIPNLKIKVSDVFSTLDKATARHATPKWRSYGITRPGWDHRVRQDGNYLARTSGGAERPG